MRVGQGLEPHGLPDAGGGRVKDTLGFHLPVLLPARQAEVLNGVVGAHHQLVVAVLHGVGDIGTEWGMATFMARHLDIVDPHRRLVIDRTKMQHQTVRVGGPETTPVPNRVVERALADP